MTPEHHELVGGYLDGLLTEQQEAELNAWVKADPAHAAAFADAVRLHDQLRNRFRNHPVVEPLAARPRRHRWKWAGVAVGIASAVLSAVWLFPTPASAAEELDRLIDRAAPTDRTYRIRSLDALPEAPDERRPPLDGATLHVRAPDRYVLIRKFPDGRPFVTGSDGERSWSVPPEPNRPVRVSHDPMRFRGPLPGNQQGIPFADLRSDLAEVRVAYTLTKLPFEGGLSGLRAEKKSAEYRGAKRIELWYDPVTSVIRRMVFAGMPKARGGPDSVAVELVEQRDLGETYFRHETHHPADRRVIEEE